MPDDRTRHRGRGPVVGEEEQDGRQRPVPAPHQRAESPPRRWPCPAAEDARPTLWFRLRQPSSVEADRGQAIRPISPYRNTEPGAPVRADGRSGEDQAEAFPEEPDAEGPEERDGQGGPHGPPEQQSQSDRHLDEREEGVPDGDMRPDEVVPGRAPMLLLNWAMRRAR